MNIKCQVILGPPGTGKTTKLLSLMEECLKQGYHPREIGFVSFTRKAAHEARDRAMETFTHFRADDFHYFRTLHSLAFECLGMTPAEVLKGNHYHELSEVVGYRVTGQYQRLDDDYTSYQTLGDKMLFLDNLSRLSERPLQEIWHEANIPALRWDELDRFSRALALFKEQRFLTEFTDMILRFLKEEIQVPLKVLFVDEAQDLGRAQWRMVEKLSAKCDKVFVAGDDDQAIFQWAGADVETFNNLPGERMVLAQSYRIPKQVHNVALFLKRFIKNSQEKVWAPREEMGTVHSHVSLEKGNFDLSQGTWLLLARNNCLLKPIEEYCKRRGYSFASSITDPDTDAIKAIFAWEALRKGQRIKHAEAMLIYRYMSSGKEYEPRSRKKLEGANETEFFTIEMLQHHFGLRTQAEWYEALSKIPLDMRSYYRAVRRRGETIHKTPRLRISTIHGAKGGEADNVLLLTDMTTRTLQSLHSRPSDEHRVWYVGVTRARNSLHIVKPAVKGYNYLADLKT